MHAKLHFLSLVMIGTLFAASCGYSSTSNPDEICDNGIDDDQDGLTDCSDDDCAGTAACTCQPSCTGKCCGDDGCGGTCPDNCAATGQTCGADCRCEGACVPLTCEDLGYECGVWSDADGCGGDLSCGTCPQGQQCSQAGVCETECVSDCTGKECGDDGCGNSCGSCDAGETCENGVCVQQATTPVIIDLSSNTAVMNENTELIITAIVTDPQGIGDLIGGTLKNESETLSYGAFSTSGEEGSYQIALYWNDLDTVEPIWAERAGRERVFTALFYDQAGHMASDNISVTLQCTAGRASCDGDCLDHQDICDGGNTCIDVGGDPLNCGACDFSCPAVSNGDPICVSELCDVDCHDGYARCGATECREALSDDNNCGGCDQSCETDEGCLYGNCIADDLTVTTITSTTSISIYAEEEKYFIIEVATPINLEVEWESAGYVCDCDYALWSVDDISWSLIDSEYNWSNECTMWGYSGDLDPDTYIYMMGGCADGIGSVNFHLTPITK